MMKARSGTDMVITIRAEFSNAEIRNRDGAKYWWVLHWWELTDGIESAGPFLWEGVDDEVTFVG